MIIVAFNYLQLWITYGNRSLFTLSKLLMEHLNGVAGQICHDVAVDAQRRRHRCVLRIERN